MNDVNNLTTSAMVSSRTGDTLALPAITDPVAKVVVAILADRLRDSLDKLEVIVDWLKNPENNGSDQLRGVGLIAEGIAGELLGLEDGYGAAFRRYDLKDVCRALDVSIVDIEVTMERAALEAEEVAT